MNKELKKVIKKDGTLEDFNGKKIHIAINKSAARINYKFTSAQEEKIINFVKNKIRDDKDENVPVLHVHGYVEMALDKYAPEVAKCYRDYRNYKQDFVHIMDNVYQGCQELLVERERENANEDSTLVSTQQALARKVLDKELYCHFSLTRDELQAEKNGYIYIHDKSARRYTMNCCLFDIGEVLSHNFEINNQWYEPPKRLSSAFSIIGDLVMTTAAQQYGGFTIPELDKVLAPYAEKSFNKYKKDYLDVLKDNGLDTEKKEIIKKAEEHAYKKVEFDFRQGYQGLEYKFNTVGSSRGDYPFVTVTFGLGTGVFEKMCSRVILQVHAEGQGRKGAKRPVLFPKLVFLYDKELHGFGKVNEDLREEAIRCSAKTMYPDWLSLTGEGYVSEIYKKYKKAISPMGCRAFLSPWYKEGGMYPKDENDEPVFVGRFNIGVVSLNLPMILAKARRESRNFYEVLDYYLEMIRQIHLKTYEFLAEKRASINPLGFCFGGFYGGHLNYNDKIAPVLESATASFGITALNELQELYNKTSITKDSDFALEVMQYINDKVAEFKKEDGKLYAIYGTPAENLCGLQAKQFRKEFGIVKGVSDRGYVSNSFHCPVWEDISPIEKQNKESKFWDLFNGGKIQYCKYPLQYNIDAIRTLVMRAMDMGLYEGVNFDLAYCDDCGEQGFDGDVCPKCGSTNIVKIERMNGYLAFYLVKGESRLNDAKVEEIKERVSM